jgi:hypothetical protein
MDDLAGGLQWPEPNEESNFAAIYDKDKGGEKIPERRKRSLAKLDKN